MATAAAESRRNKLEYPDSLAAIIDSREILCMIYFPMFCVGTQHNAGAEAVRAPQYF